MRTTRISLVCTAVVLCLAVLACVISPKLPGQTQGTSSPQGNNGNGTVPYRGSGSQDLADPAIGLDGLTAYQAVLTISFDGTQDDQPSVWSETRTLTVDSAAQTRLLGIEDSGLPEESSLNGWLLGKYNGFFVQRRGAGVPCGLLAVQDIQLPSTLEPASHLPPVFGAQETGSTDVVGGISVKHYTFDHQAVGLQDSDKVKGEMALAEQGGFVVAYDLSIDGTPDFYGSGMKGAMTWKYSLGNVNGTVKPALPADCPPGMVDVAPMEGAANVDDRPGMQEYTLNADLTALVDYYKSKLAAAGYEPVSDPVVSDELAYLDYTRQDLILSVMARVKADKSLGVTVSLENSQAETAITVEQPTPNPTEAASLAGADLEKRVDLALNLLLGDAKNPSKLLSYHLELSETTPTMKNGSLQASSSQLSADVNGQDVHLKQVQDNKTVEGYMIGGQEYEVANGKVSPSVGTVSITWAMWPLDVIMPLTTASLGTTSQGEETLEGRLAEKYDLDTSKAPPGTLETLTSMSPLGVNIVSAKGTIWVDKETGALLKLTLDYEAQLKNPASGSTSPSVSGHIDLTVTQVGAVEVKLP